MLVDAYLLGLTIEVDLFMERNYLVYIIYLRKMNKKQI